MKRRLTLALAAFSVVILTLVASEMIGLSNLHGTVTWSGNRPISASAADDALQKHRIFQLAKREFPDWYERLLEEFVQKIMDDDWNDQIAMLMRRRTAELALQNAHFTAKASPAKLDELVRGRLAFVQWLEANNSAACSQFVQTYSVRGSAFAGLSKQSGFIAALKKKASTELEAVIDGRKHQSSYAAPTKNDYRLLSNHLAAQGWSNSQILYFASLINSGVVSNGLKCGDWGRFFEAVLSIEDQDTRSRLIAKIFTGSAIPI